MLLFVFFTFKITYIKKKKKKNCPDNLSFYTAEVGIISIIIKTTSLRAIVLPIINKRGGRV